MSNFCYLNHFVNHLGETQYITTTYHYWLVLILLHIFIQNIYIFLVLNVFITLHITLNLWKNRLQINKNEAKINGWHLGS